MVVFRFPGEGGASICFLAQFFFEDNSKTKKPVVAKSYKKPRLSSCFFTSATPTVNRDNGSVGWHIGGEGEDGCKPAFKGQWIHHAHNSAASKLW